MPASAGIAISNTALLLVALASAACKTMKSVTLDQLNILGPDSVWVTESDQSVVVIYDPKVVGDTLVGYIGKRHEKVPSAGFKQLRVQTSAPRSADCSSVVAVRRFHKTLD
jgi:hypothetical protein